MVPSFVGPAIAAWLTHHLDWRAVFWAVIPVLVIGSAMMLPPVLRVANHPPEGVLLRTACRALGRRTCRGRCRRGAAGRSASWPDQASSSEWSDSCWSSVSLPNLMPAGFFRLGPGLPPVIVVRALIAGAFFGAEAFVPLMLVEQQHLSLLLAGSTLTVGALGWSTGALVAVPAAP